MLRLTRISPILFRRVFSSGTSRLCAADAVQVEDDTLKHILGTQLSDIKAAGTFKQEFEITTPQGPSISVDGIEGVVVNFCSNNYLGLSNHPRLIDAAHKALDSHGFGLSSVRFICGTQDLHKQLERKISDFHGTADTILYPSCFDANAGLFESILTAEDAVLSDKLNHASIIDGIRLCKARRYRYEHLDMEDLEGKLTEASDARMRLIATDGVFSMDGHIAPLAEICALAKKHDALVFVDDCHATGFLGRTGRGTDEHCGVVGQVDIINSTLGKAMGGATGGYTTGRKEVVDILRQRARPYLFSNTLAPPVAAASITAFDMVQESTGLRDQLMENTDYFRTAMTQAGFDIKEGTHPIVPIMLFDAALAGEMAQKLLQRGVYLTAFSYPVVPKGQARIRVQLSAAHTKEHLEKAISSFKEVGKELGVIV
ncbi:2-amino-3-ketobutyrate coenzyme A ligase [Coccomyxa subellipsoidea C-169]|uniref:2-amino-3-ketobutyrate coenzyme A ligase, mitochondrial n=1 Tax=Coccomyxa subellipsoidea (strain C-169) TaxID=574566 RepID=I0Z7U0_COCSC|nr:2-amino-3-ketobutyrate coenzyme A ligase [Coccomyxa subellipsoidea C-169]EIE26709.1 2-amino-3-ketobutyrate coenzyme A ligase [Coccomyxa subellipsoidea C-169]|eukprot:XP_005651253.1 2-amino-3-ketobutyrate coenzyme A ligase [Coccomyxa subellipsoidea C-169]